MGDERSVGAARFVVTEAETVRTHGDYYTIQTAAAVSETTRIGEDSESMFRIGYDASLPGQILLPGSTFEQTDDVGAKADEPKPYRYDWR